MKRKKKKHNIERVKIEKEAERKMTYDRLQ